MLDLNGSPSAIGNHVDTSKDQAGRAPQYLRLPNCVPDGFRLYKEIYFPPYLYVYFFFLA
jgi:hypothetical protein